MTTMATRKNDTLDLFGETRPIEPTRAEKVSKAITDLITRLGFNPAYCPNCGAELEQLEGTWIDVADLTTGGRMRGYLCRKCCQ